MEEDMNQAIIKINPADYNLTETRGSDIAKAFEPVQKKMSYLYDEYENIINISKGDDLDEELCKEAADLQRKVENISEAIRENV